MKIFISGSAGLLGGEAAEYFGSKGHTVHGLDNNQRKEFFGAGGDTNWNLHRIAHKIPNYIHHESDIRDRHTINWLFETQGKFDVVIHCAAQPSHDKSREIPIEDFDINAVGTLNILEATRKHSPDAVFIFLSTNKTYGTAPNEIPLVEDTTRYEYLDEYYKGVDETCRIDQSTHSIFGASKVAADVLVQEYGHIYGLKTTVFRGGCLTGPGHSGVELHGFLSYLVKCCINDKTYKIYGYKGKQVRDNLHSYDVVRAMEEVIANPGQGEVFNLGGGRENSVSILEAIEKVEKLTGKKLKTEYVPENRVGDHICYISDMSKFRARYPNWQVTKSVDDILEDILRQQYWGLYSDHKETVTYPLTEQSAVLDIGGYRGTWSQDIINRYNPYVYIFEPIKEFFSACQFRFKDNPKVKVFNYGLGGKNSRAILKKQGMNTSAVREEMPKDCVFGDPVPEEVEVRDIAEVFPFDKVDLVSLNCEGTEYEVLRRLIDTNLIDRIEHLQIQFHDFFPDAKALRGKIRTELAERFTESFSHEFVWESWKSKT